MKLHTISGLKLFQAAILSMLFGLLSLPLLAQPVPQEPRSEGAIEVLHVQGNVWLIAGAGGNIAVQAGEQGIILVDTGAQEYSEEVIEAIASISDRPIRYIINTSMAEQHVGGNAQIASLPGGSTSGATRGARIAVIAQENVLFGMSVARGPDGEQVYPQESWPTEGYFEPHRSQVFNDEAIDIYHMPNAYSNGDSVVYFRGSNVMVSGDIFTTTNLPLINPLMGGSLQGTIAALDHMLEITVAGDFAEGGTYIIPGHGYIADEAELVEYRDMAYIIRDRIQHLVREEEASLEEVIAARPVLGWESRYSNPGWTVDMFIEALYEEFTAQ
tara:strand:+ start:76986 stop:77972 length:987 start_codon:yes stop_codon:yes gene_type:complete